MLLIDTFNLSRFISLEEFTANFTLRVVLNYGNTLFYQLGCVVWEGFNKHKVKSISQVACRYTNLTVFVKSYSPASGDSRRVEQILKEELADLQEDKELELGFTRYVNEK